MSFGRAFPSSSSPSAADRQPGPPREGERTLEHRLRRVQPPSTDRDATYPQPCPRLDSHRHPHHEATAIVFRSLRWTWAEFNRPRLRARGRTAARGRPARTGRVDPRTKLP